MNAIRFSINYFFTPVNRFSKKFYAYSIVLTFVV